MYSSERFYQGDTYLEGNYYLSSPLFDAITKFTDAIVWALEKIVNRSNSLQIYFGVNASQDSNYLYIKKSDLTGLTPSNSNTAESLFVALILKVLDKTNDVEDSIVVTLFDSYISESRFKNTFLIELNYKATLIDYEIQELPEEINPNNYEYIL